MNEEDGNEDTGIEVVSEDVLNEEFGSIDDIEVLKNELTDDQLVTLTNELFRRALRAAHNIIQDVPVDYLPTIWLFTNCRQQGKDFDMSAVGYKIEIDNARMETNNPVEAARICAQRFIQDKQLAPCKQLTHVKGE